MNGEAVKSLEIRRRRLQFRSWHRGMKEVDLMLGRFADKHVLEMTENQVSEFESLLELPDPDIYNWIVGAEPVPAEYETKILRHLIDFYRAA